LDRYPLPVHQDELSDIYDGYCLATTGADRSGESWPLLIRGMGPGDYHPPAYVYLAAIPGYFAGFSIGWGRLPAALAGLLTVWLVYLTARRLLDERVGLLALMFVAFSPIHILCSRQAHEGLCLVPLCVIAIVYLLVRLTQTIESPGPRSGIRMAMVAGFVIGLSTNTYTGQRLTAYLFGCAVIAVIAWTLIIRRREVRHGVKLIGVFAAMAVVGAAPQLYALAAQPEHFFVRAGNTVYPLHCGFQWWSERIATNLALNLDPTYLFLSFGEYSLLSITRLNVASLPFLYLGLLGACVLPFTRGRLPFIWIPIAVLFSLAPAVITEGNPSSMRSSGVWALYPIVSAIGVGVVVQFIVAARAGIASRWRTSNNTRPRGEAEHARSRRLKPAAQEGGRSNLGQVTGSSAPGRWVMASASLLIIGAGAYDAARYLSRPHLHGPGAQHHFVQIADWIRANDAGYERIYVDAPGMFGYLYLASLTGMSADQYHQAERWGRLRGLGWDEYDRFDRFYFASRERARRDWGRAEPKHNWLVIDDALSTHILSAAANDSALTASDFSGYSVP